MKTTNPVKVTAADRCVGGEPDACSPPTHPADATVSAHLNVSLGLLDVLHDRIDELFAALDGDAPPCDPAGDKPCLTPIGAAAGEVRGRLEQANVRLGDLLARLR